jgi:hypothetical protein
VTIEVIERVAGGPAVGGGVAGTSPQLRATDGRWAEPEGQDTGG